jgi:hypothetical protein
MSTIKMTPKLEVALIRLRDHEQSLAMAPLASTWQRTALRNRNLAVKALCRILREDADPRDADGFIHYDHPTMSREEIVSNNRRQAAKNAAKTRARWKAQKKIFDAYGERFGHILWEFLTPEMYDAMASSLKDGRDHLMHIPR